MASIVLLDACVLYPAALRDLLIELACANLFQARWTHRIQDEWIRSLMAHRPDLRELSLRTAALAMDHAVEDAVVEGYDYLIPALTLPDPDDRHVLAAAVHARADVIVTFNLRDFPTEVLAPLNIEAQHPDAFIRGVLDLDEDAIHAVGACRRRLKAPAKSVEDYLVTLASQGLPETARYLCEWADVI